MARPKGYEYVSRHRHLPLINMLVVDISEHPDVKRAFVAKLGKDGFKIEQLGSIDCRDHLFPEAMIGCITKDEMDNILNKNKPIGLEKDRCHTCHKRKYIRFADFTNDTNSFYYERKTVFDFISSRKSRLYNQLNKMDAFIEGRKGLILEGMSDYVPVYDAYWKHINKNELGKLSPIQQVIHLDNKPEWTWSFIRELKMRDMEFVQTWNLNETIDFLIQCDLGYDHEPKLRLSPKRYPDITLERNILALFDGIGKVRSEKILKEHKDITIDLKRLIKKVNRLGYGNES